MRKMAKDSLRKAVYWKTKSSFKWLICINTLIGYSAELDMHAYRLVHKRKPTKS